MKIYKGIIKKVPNEKHFEDYNNGKLKMKDVHLKDTIIKMQGENGEFDVLPIKLSYQELDSKGNEMFTFDTETEVYMKSFRQTPTLYATGKELRILCELGELTPVKLVVDEREQEDRIFLNITCIQNQRMGLEESFNKTMSHKPTRGIDV
ncbi:MAG: hypothetical protein ACK5NF_06385 [Bacilli bacterium]